MVRIENMHFTLFVILEVHWEGAVLGKPYNVYQ